MVHSDMFDENAPVLDPTAGMLINALNYARRGDADMMIKWLKRAYAVTPNNDDAKLLQALWRRKDCQQAAEILTPIVVREARRCDPGG